MNRCTNLDEILQEHVHPQPPDTHMGFRCFSVCVTLRLPVNST